MRRILATTAAALGLAGLALAPAPQPATRPETEVRTEERIKSTGPKPKRKGPPAGYVRKTLPNPGWKRLTGGGRGWYPVRNRARDPRPMTRQVARRHAIDKGWGAGLWREVRDAMQGARE